MKILFDILKNKNQRYSLIKKFQERIWNDDKYSNNKMVNEVLKDLAYDLDFYEPDDNLRKESASYYGDARLEEEIKAALRKIEYYTKAKD